MKNKSGDTVVEVEKNDVDLPWESYNESSVLVVEVEVEFEFVLLSEVVGSRYGG